MIRRLIISLCMLSFVSAVGACSDTWHGVKKDTGDRIDTLSAWPGRLGVAIVDK
jgi:hypothetical protein